MAENKLEKIDVYYSICNGGDGSAYPSWFLDKSLCDKHAEGEEWGEPCAGHVETFVGSNIYKSALEDEAYFKEELEEKAAELEFAKEKFKGVTSCMDCGEHSVYKGGTREYIHCGLQETMVQNPDVIDKACPLK